MKQGEEDATKIIAEHNIKLVLYEVTNRFKFVEYDQRDLVSIGNVGLMKAITTFDTSKKVAFSTYVIKCIDNEILIFLKKLQKDQRVDSLDRVISNDTDGNVMLKDTISDEKDIGENYEKEVVYKIIRDVVKELPNRERKIIMFYFGVNSDNIYTQKDMGDMLSLSQAHVSGLIPKIVDKIGKELNQKGIVELKSNKKIKVEDKCNSMPEKLNKEQKNKQMTKIYKKSLF